MITPDPRSHGHNNQQEVPNECSTIELRVHHLNAVLGGEGTNPEEVKSYLRELLSSSQLPDDERKNICKKLVLGGLSELDSNTQPEGFKTFLRTCAFVLEVGGDAARQTLEEIFKITFAPKASVDNYIEALHLSIYLGSLTHAFTSLDDGRTDETIEPPYISVNNLLAGTVLHSWLESLEECVPKGEKNHLLTRTVLDLIGMEADSDKPWAAALCHQNLSVLVRQLYRTTP